MNKILYLRDFIEDGRMSMEIYANLLVEYVLKKYPDLYNVEEFIPKVPSLIQSKNGMRIARYFLYPLQILGKKASIYHIIDHGYSHLINFLNSQKTIITIHDLIPVLLWKGKIPNVKSHHIPLLLLFSINSLRRARYIIAVSENTKKDLIRLIKMNPDKIFVINPGIDPIFYHFNENQKHDARQKWFGENTSENKILITGSQFYKNPEMVLKTLSYMQSKAPLPIKLVKTMHSSPEWEMLLQKYRFEKNIISLGKVPREEMPSLFNAVDILFFPSIYEGFGWPPLEAMACGTPVVASNAASLPEVIGDAAPMFDPYDYLGFANEIIKIFSEVDYRRILIKKGLVQAGKFTWEKTAQKTAEVYNLIS